MRYIHQHCAVSDVTIKEVCAVFGLSAEQIYQIISNNLLYPFLVIALFWVNHNIQKEEKKSYRDLLDATKKESQAREDRLMEHLTLTNEAHVKIAAAMEKMEYRMEAIERKLS